MKRLLVIKVRPLTWHLYHCICCKIRWPCHSRSSRGVSLSCSARNTGSPIALRSGPTGACIGLNESGKSLWNNSSCWLCKKFRRPCGRLQGSTRSHQYSTPEGRTRGRPHGRGSRAAWAEIWRLMRWRRSGWGLSIHFIPCKLGCHSRFQWHMLHWETIDMWKGHSKGCRSYHVNHSRTLRPIKKLYFELKDLCCYVNYHLLIRYLWYLAHFFPKD